MVASCGCRLNTSKVRPVSVGSVAMSPVTSQGLNALPNRNSLSASASTSGPRSGTSGRMPGQVQLRDRDQLGELVDADDAEAPEERVVQLVRPGERAGVRLRAAR